MANIYTRRDGKPRTTTFADFKFHKDFSYKNTKLQTARLLSPNRSKNPHSLGLIYQNPYNKDNLTFSIWSPPFCKNFQDKFSHMQETNWTCKHEATCENLLEQDFPGKPPKIRYSTSSTSRQSYQDPAKRMANWKNCSPLPPTRYSSNPERNRDPVVGIVPNAVVLPPINKDEKNTPPNSATNLTS
ncbi:uncharacterized protein LOC105440877 [Strongylocentrotus purpuratus]|uniref:Uncharacterized protein n=1 Tax=Strongylocentrotus purpuratus TaxID=7668 RepID=A0A7M7HL37_STRPU|nr:uncharacterized protein LOC105440877 [Strongylocentrotus purpuratus]|eukprot:XP_011669763.1 PREDICTED: uncharacterized protein LOC105440877 [Strongylocentrotus purpuratus]